MMEVPPELFEKLVRLAKYGADKHACNAAQNEELAKRWASWMHPSRVKAQSDKALESRMHSNDADMTIEVAEAMLKVMR